jgi:hypothetical protein
VTTAIPGEVIADTGHLTAAALGWYDLAHANGQDIWLPLGGHVRRGRGERKAKP